MSEPRIDVPIRPDRRVVLAGIGAGAAGVLLAGCGGGSDSSNSDSGNSASGGSSGQPAAGASLKALDQIPDGGTVSAKDSSGRKLLLHRSGQIVTALSAKCTHAGCTVSPSGASLECPCHGSKFQPGTGAVVQGPATDPLPAVAVSVQNGQVVLA